MYTPRFTIPDEGNPYYNTKKKGGYSNAIEGKPVCPGLNVLANCVGYANSRYAEIQGLNMIKYQLVCNAEQFIIKAKSYGLTIGTTPKLGSIIVWSQGSASSGGDGAGHVAVVEQINSDGSIITSESGYNARRPFWTQTRTNKDGRWGQGSKYNFLGFIYNPAVPDEPTGDFEVNEIVNFLGGNHHTSANDKGSGTYKEPSLARITDIYPTGKYPYHCRKVNDKGNYVGGGVYGWVSPETITKLDSDKSAIKAEINDINVAIDKLNQQVSDINQQIADLNKRKVELEAML